MKVKRHRWILVLVVVLSSALGAFAQALVPTSARPPSAASGQNSAPASQPPDYSKEPFIIERAFSKVSFQSDGRSLQETTIRVHVQSQAGLQNYGVLHLAFASATSNIEIGYVRVTKPDKRVVQTPAENALNMPAEITRQAPFYSDLKEKQVAVKGLEIGDILEFQYRLGVDKPLDPNQFWFSYNFTHSGILLEEELQVSVPRDRYVNVKSSEVQPTISDNGDIRTYDWKTANLEREATKPADTEEIPSVQITTFRSWDEVGQWFRSLASPQAAVTPEIQAKANELTAGMKTDSEKIQAIYRFVSTKFRYIGISLGIGRYQPHAAAEVLSNDYGDCKDKHTLFTALLSAVGVKVYPALVNSNVEIDPGVPSPAQFDHVITALPQENGFLFLDTTPEVAPFGFLVAGVRDKQALVIPEKSVAQLVQTPADPPFKSFFTFQADGTLDDAGTLDSKMLLTLRGDSELVYRLVLRQAGQTEWKNVMQVVSSNLGFGGTVSDVTANSPDATDVPLRIGYSYNRKEYSDWENRRISPPFPFLFLPDTPDAGDKKMSPIKLGSPTETLYEATILLPKGSNPAIPGTIDLHESFADYHAEYSFAKGSMHFERRLVMKVHEIPPDQFDTYRKFQKKIMDDVSNYISLSIGTSSESSGLSGKPDVPALMQQGRAAYARRDMPGALAALQRAVDLDPKSAPAWFTLGAIHIEVGPEDQGIGEVKKAIAIDPALPQYKYTAASLQSRHHEQAAIEIWRALEAARPEDSDAPQSIGGILLQQGRYSEAAAELEPAVQRLPMNSTLLLMFGETYIRLGSKEKGVAAIEKSVQIDPNPESLNGAAYSLADNNIHLDEALQYAENAVGQTERATSIIELKDLTLDDIELMPALASYWDTLGWVQFRMGHLGLAESYLNAAWSLLNAPMIADHLGQVYEKDGKKHEAAVAYSHALSTGGGAPQETKARLESIRPGGKYQPGEGPDPISVQNLRSVKLQRVSKTHVSAEFFVLFAPGSKVVDTTFVGGSEELRDATKDIAEAHFDVSFPDDGPAQVLRRGVLSCEPNKECLFVLIPPDDVNSVN
jgi:tetratricopeptide (TPR) repeat protein